VLPYASYLRVYEPLHALPAAVRNALRGGTTAVQDGSATLAAVYDRVGFVTAR